MDSPTVADRRAWKIAAGIEHQFQVARSSVGLAFDQVVLDGFALNAPLAPRQPDSGLGELYDAYMADPTRDWSPTTRMAYLTTMRVVLAILGHDTPAKAVTRSMCREMIEVLRWQPRNASKLFPNCTPMEIAARAKAEGRNDLINSANINTYLNKLGAAFNWAVKEEAIDRNPCSGLRVPDLVARRDKRLPFSTSQMVSLFSAPLYVGCRDDGHGYAVPGPKRPKGARFWIPLVSMFGGLRLNEACQLDVADIRQFDDIECFVVTEQSDDEDNDKRLKTSASGVVPIHAKPIELGCLVFVNERRCAGEIKLFAEVGMGSTGYRSTTFYAWFRRFATRAGANSPKTCSIALGTAFETPCARLGSNAISHWHWADGPATVGQLRSPTTMEAAIGSPRSKTQ